MKKEKDVGGRPSPGTAISDPRFARVHTDPRFMRMPKSKTKVSIDKRFAHMFSDKSFSDPLGADKRGRAKKKKEKHMLQRYYKVGDDEEKGEGAAGDGEGTDEEGEIKSKSRGKGSGKTVAKSAGGKKLGEKTRSKELARPKFPGPVVPFKLGLGLQESDDEESDEEDDSDEEIELKQKLKGKEDRKLVAKSSEGKKLGEKAKNKELARPKSSKPALKEGDEEDDSDVEIHQKSKLKAEDAGKQPAKAKGKELPRSKHSAPIVEESDDEEDTDEEIDLNSDESEEELEQDAGRKIKNRNALIAQQDGDSDSEEEEEGDEDASSEIDEESSSSSSSSESEAEEGMEDPRDEEKVPTAPGAETRRFAMMNMDWEHIKSVDLLMLMRSFQPKGGRVECITIYPSEFGIEQMKKEEVRENRFCLRC